MTDSIFHDLDVFVAEPRIAGMAMSHDASRLVVSVQTLDEKGTGYVTSLWEIDPAAAAAPRRLTRGASSESIVGFGANGDVLFSTTRTVSTISGAEDDGSPPSGDVPGLWALPVGGGEARCLLARRGGIGDVLVAAQSGSMVLAGPTLPSTDDDVSADDSSVHARSESKVSAVLHERYPVRFWDHDLGPASTRLFAADAVNATASAGDDDARLELRDLTGDVAGAIHDEASFDVSADGSVIVTEWMVAEAGASLRISTMRIDVATGERRLIADDPDLEFDSPAISPDGSHVAIVRAERSTPELSPHQTLAVVPIDGGEPRLVAADWDLWPQSPRWSADGSSLVVAVDEDGRGPLYLVDVASGERRRLTNDDGTYVGHDVSPDGTTVFALRTTVDTPMQPVRISIADGTITTIPSPVANPEIPGKLTAVTTPTADGTAVRSWLALPADASADAPAPLLLWIHGGPLASWNAWSWRWNPWTAVARGYAVLLPDPALSTGYGRDFIERGWGSWGGAPFTDLMDITDAAVARDDIDETRTSAMGGSFGGYMANWVAGHTDRFDAIVTHASLWALDQFGPTTDASYYWSREMTDEMAAANSPHLHVDRITTPTLVIHGDRDYRVPIGEGLRLWYELVRASADENGEMPHRFLYFPDENHWILSPNNAQAWYATVFAFLEQHVLGGDWVRPDQIAH
ncbi:MAG: prolyl oligopeptidase family serine peptidase [Ilumatobacter sp.]